MKTIVFLINVITLFFTAQALAGFQVSQSTSSDSHASFIPYKDVGKTELRPRKRTYRSYLRQEGVPAYSNNVAIPATPVYAVSISGSLKQNIERIMHRYNWRVVWKAPYDYNFDGRVTGTSLPNVVEKLLQPFPLQAVMYMSNRTLAIVPRTTHA